MVATQNKYEDELLNLRSAYSRIENKFNTPFEGKYSRILNRIREDYKADYESYIHQMADINTSNIYRQLAANITFTVEGSVHSCRIFLKPFYDETIELIPWMFDTYDLLLANTPKFMHYYLDGKQLRERIYEYSSYSILRASQRKEYEDDNISKMKDRIDHLITRHKLNSFYYIDSVKCDDYDEYGQTSPISNVIFKGTYIKEMTEFSKPYKG